MGRQRYVFISAVLVSVFGFQFSVFGQFPSALVSWEGQPVNVTTAKEVFQRPQTSGSTQGIVMGNESFNDAFRSNAQGGFDGVQAYQVFWSWVSASDPTAWVRLTSFNTVTLPNPTVDLNGKVRFRIKNVSEFFNGTIGLCIGIRETGINAPLLANGGTTGTIEWVGVDPTINAVIEPWTGGNGMANTAAGGDDVQVIPVGATAAPGAVIISPGPNGIIDTAPAGDDQTRFGYFLDANGNRVPIPAITVPITDWMLVEWDLPSGDVSINGGAPINGAIVGFTGDGILSAPNSRGVLEHLAITNVVSDPATSIVFFLDTLQFEGSVVEPPIIQAPIVVNAPTVTVNNISGAATSVTLHVDNGTDPDQVASPNGAASVVFTLPHPAIIGQTYTAFQTGSFGVSPVSAPVTVQNPPPAAPSLVSPIEQGNTTVNVSGVAAGVSQVTVKADGAPIGSVMSPPAGTVGVPVPPLTGGQSITATQTGAGGESAASAALRVGSGNGPVRVCIGVRETGPAGGTSGPIEFVAASPGSGVPPGGQVLNLNNAFQTLTFDPNSMDPNLVVRGFTGNGVIDGQFGVLEMLAVSIDPALMGASNGVLTLYVDNVVNVGAGAGGTDVLVADFEAVAVGQEAVFQEPGFSGSTSGNIQAPPNSSTVTDAFASGGIHSDRMTWFFKDIAPTRWVRITTFNTANGGNPLIDITKPVRMDIRLAASVPTTPAPTLVSPVEQGNTTVTVANVASNATDVTVYANGSPIGSINPAGNTTVTVSVATLVAGQSIQARQTAPPNGLSGPSDPLRVGSGNGPIFVSAGVRETGDAGPIGSNGTGTGPIEWIGPTSVVGGAPIGKPLGLSDNWQTVTFDPAVDPIVSFSGGNGVLDSPNGQGTFEHLAITVNPSAMGASNGVFVLYIDNVVNVGAGAGGTDVVLQDFETAMVGMEALFQEPSFSGSTDANISVPPNESLVSNLEHNGAGAQSDRVTWFFKDIAPSRWLRLTTAGTSPIVSFSHPIRMDLLLRPPSAALANIVSANPPAASGNPYQAGLPFTDVLDTGTTNALTAGIGAAGTQGQGAILYSPLHVTFSAAPSPAPAPGNIGVACTGGTCPTVTSVTPGSGANEFLIALSSAIPPLQCTTLTFAGTTAGQKLQYRSHPGNVNLDNATNTQDLLALVQALNNGTANQPGNFARYNVNRSQESTPVNTQDLLRLVQLLNGVNTTQAFAGATAATCP
ncbi:MAG TPA: hypothetical protein VGM03_15735 [Phycisphaerae bacterium]|jgi:hypothetical protein